MGDKWFMSWSASSLQTKRKKLYMIWGDLSIVIFLYFLCLATNIVLFEEKIWYNKLHGSICIKNKINMCTYEETNAGCES